MILVSANGFISAPQDEKCKLIESAIKMDGQYKFSRNCLLSIIEYQKRELENVYDAFVCDNLSQADFDGE